MLSADTAASPKRITPSLLGHRCVNSSLPLVWRSGFGFTSAVILRAAFQLQITKREMRASCDRVCPARQTPDLNA